LRASTLRGMTSASVRAGAPLARVTRLLLRAGRAGRRCGQCSRWKSLGMAVAEPRPRRSVAPFPPEVRLPLGGMTTSGGEKRGRSRGMAFASRARAGRSRRPGEKLLSSDESRQTFVGSARPVAAEGGATAATRAS